MIRRLVTILCLSLLFACARDNDAPPDTGPPPNRDASVDAGARDATNPDAIADAGETPDSGEHPDATGIDAEPQDGGSDCGGDGACFSCPPANSQEITNRCGPAFGDCTPFDNRGRLPLLNPNGSLPPLP